MFLIHGLSRPTNGSGGSVCARCLLRLSRTRGRWKPRTSNRSLHGLSISDRPSVQAWNNAFFSANRGFNRSSDAIIAETREKSYPHVATEPSSGVAASTVPLQQRQPIPRRRRRRSNPDDANAESFLPSNSASNLSTISSQLPAASLRRLFTACLALSKPRLSFLIVLTTATSYSLFPVPALLLPSVTASPSLSALTMVFLTTGTALCSASANAFNMLLEPKYDAQMSRTRNRPLVRGLISKQGAFMFAVAGGVLGTGALFYGVNPTVAFLGGLNIFLYAGIYTPMKRISVLNTWIGAVVGGIPPLMGWAAAAGQSATGNGSWQELLVSDISVGGWLLAGLLYAWQFPHFNSLSWPIREEYKNAGYRMLVWTNSRMNGRVALRYAILCFPICFGLYYYGITDQGFLVTSSVANAWMVREAWRFWRKEGHKGSARGLFWASVWHLPVVLVLAMVHKAGLWQGVWNRIAGQDGVEEEGEDAWGKPAKKPLAIS